MAIFKTSGDISATELQTFFSQSGDFQITDYYRGGGIVPATRGGGGMQEITTLTATGSVSNPAMTADTQVYRRTDFHSRLGRGSNGADNTSVGPGTWGVYPNNSDYSTNPSGVAISATALTLNAQYDLLFNRLDQADNNIEATFQAFEIGDTIRIQRNAGLTNAGNGYVFTLTSVPSLQDDDSDNRPVILAMSVTVTEILGTGLLNDALLTPTDSDTVTVTRPGTANTSPVVRFTFDSSITPNTLDVTLPFGDTLTVTQQEQAFVDAFNAHDAFTATIRRTELVQSLASFRGGGLGSDSTYWYPSTVGGRSDSGLSALPDSGDLFISHSTSNSLNAGFEIGTLPFTPTNGLQVRIGSGGNFTIYNVTQVSQHSDDDFNFRTYTLDSTSRTTTGTGAASPSSGANLFLSARATTITNNVAGAVDDMTFVINGGTPGLTTAAYTLDVTQQGAAAGPTYPDTGGIATDDVGSVTHGSSTNYSWPINAATLQGATDGFRYAAGDGTNSFNTNGQIFNETGANINLNNVNITVRITFTSIPDGATTITPFFWFRNNTLTSFFSNPAVSVGNQQAYTGTPNAQTSTWANGEAIQFIMFSTTSDRPFTYTVDNIRINLNSSTDEFLPSGGGTTDINTTFPESGDITFTDFYGVDNGADDDSRQRRDVEEPYEIPGSPGESTPPGPDGIIRT